MSNWRGKTSFRTLIEARTVIEAWREDYNKVRPHGSLGWRSSLRELELPLGQKAGRGRCP
ncbi:MAG: integrase core domain-containing protein [Elusimicrobiales bacterium]|nr:integrase core domain-containing protein [Elusimicrobiales bacterium]